MNFGAIDKMSEYYLANMTRKSKGVGRADSTDFLNAISAKAAGRTTGMSFQDMWQARFPGAYYHTMDASNIPMGAWCRNDYPFEKFFRNDLDESILGWKPSGADPAMASSGVQSRLHSIAGQKSIVVPPELEEKMKNNPALARQIMEKVENYIAMDEATTPDRICSFLIVLDENGEIARCRASSHGGNITGPTKEEMQQFWAEQVAKRKRRARYMEILEEGALKRSLQTKANIKAHGKSLIDVEVVYKTYQSANYKIVPDNEAGCFDIYNAGGERLGAFSYEDIKIRQDASGKQFLISEHGTMSYDALVLDDELKEALKSVMGKDELETEALRGYTLYTHSGTGIQYLIREGEEGRGGKVLLQSEADIAKYEALADMYFNQYSNLIRDKNAAYIWADLEIKGMAMRAAQGYLSMGFDGMSYHDNFDYMNSWSVAFSRTAYKAIFQYFQNNRINLEEIQKFSAWQQVFKQMGIGYNRIN